MKRAIYLAAYTVFALFIPIIAINAQFPLVEFITETTTTTYKIAIGGFIALVAVFAFFRKNLVKWAKGFDRVTWFRGIFKWLLFIFPTGIAYVVMTLTADYAEQFIPVITWTFVSHLIAGVFSVLAEAEKVERFKVWVKE